MNNLVRFITNQMIDAVFPPQCPSCNAVVEQHGHLCGTCWGQIRFIAAPFCPRCGVALPYDPGPGAECLACQTNPPGFDQARSVMFYDNFSRALVLRFKHSDRLDAAGVYAGWMVRAGADMAQNDGLVAPVPLHWTRLFTRRYNQSAVLAQRIAQILDKPYAPALLTRTRRTPSQGTLSRNARAGNVRGAFEPQDRAVAVEGQVVLLVDDVMTTGSTASACAAALKKAGARAVHVLTLARVALPGEQVI